MAEVAENNHMGFAMFCADLAGLVRRPISQAAMFCVDLAGLLR